MKLRYLAPLLAALSAPIFAATQPQQTLTAQQSDPNQLGWMQGFPPSSDKLIRGTDSDYFSFPKLRWSVCHFQQLMPTIEVSRGVKAPLPLTTKLNHGIDDVRFQPLGQQQQMTWRQALDANYTDGLLIMHQGKVVYEYYSGCLHEQGKHAAMSVTKSIIGLLAEILVADGTLDPDASVASLLPQLANSAFADASVRQVMDMTTSLQYSEDYSDPKADVWLYTRAASPLPKPKGYQGPRSYFEYLATVKKDSSAKHGEAFAYKTINTDALGWIISKASGQSPAELLSQRLWQPLGAEQSAYFTVDSIGTPYAGGGLVAGLRDMARIGQLMLNQGQWRGKQVIPAAAVDSITQGGDPEVFARSPYKDLQGWSYRSMWWHSHNEHQAYAARGVHGQTIYVDPTADMVIVRFASFPTPKNAAIDPTSLPAYHAVAQYLMAAAER
ncbi:6-aminohexanoate hydrolase [Bacterioplanes sanyensis]|uniref:6-aminohexanoate hydrolase n=1 Tax=Bacterioplanes sanyensis TaxID=1249553 RepID=A0A222FHE3_9GAMM|nr:serine hydrolase [Bacterioplanes sanyensis]ASP38052.1 6-aminohexanoate hydrolase [Bacterioplanes sanyensis]